MTQQRILCYSQTHDGYSYWEFAWFVPIFWATSLPTNFTDAVDAPSSYGNGEIQVDGETSLVNDGYGNETSLDKYLDEYGSGKITFEPTGSTIDLAIPYVNEIGYNGQIVVWIDFDDNGTEANPETCPLPMKDSKTIIDDDCAFVTKPAEGDTTIVKQLVDESGNEEGLLN